MKNANEVLVFKVKEYSSLIKSESVCEQIDLCARQLLDDFPFDDLDFDGEVIAVTLYKGKRAVIINDPAS